MTIIIYNFEKYRKLYVWFVRCEVIKTKRIMDESNTTYTLLCEKYYAKLKMCLKEFFWIFMCKFRKESPIVDCSIV